MEVRWKEGFPHRGVDPVKAFNEVEKIRQKNEGVVSAESVLDRAKSSRSSLHALFEWDDTEAARQHRLSQARALVRSIEIVKAESSRGPLRAFEIVQKKRKGDPSDRTFYMSREEAMNDPIARQKLLEDTKGFLRSIQKRLQGFEELQPVVDAIDSVTQEEVAA